MRQFIDAGPTPPNNPKLCGCRAPLKMQCAHTQGAQSSRHPDELGYEERKFFFRFPAASVDGLVIGNPCFEILNRVIKSKLGLAGAFQSRSLAPPCITQYRRTAGHIIGKREPG